MKYKLAGFDFSVQTVRKVLGENGAEVGEMFIHRRSGWRGGPSYKFAPNAVGQSQGLREHSGTKVRELMRRIGA